MTTETQTNNFYNSMLTVTLQSFSFKFPISGDFCAKFYRSTHFFETFTIDMGTRHDLYWNSWTSAENESPCEIQHTLRWNVAAPSWIISDENVASFESYGNSNTID